MFNHFQIKSLIFGKQLKIIFKGEYEIVVEVLTTSRDNEERKNTERRPKVEKVLLYVYIILLKSALVIIKYYGKSSTKSILSCIRYFNMNKDVVFGRES